MSASMSWEEKVEDVLRNNQAILASNQGLKDSNQELKAQNEYLRRKLSDLMKQKEKMHASPTGSVHSEEDEAASNPLSSSSKKEPMRRTRREQRLPINSNGFGFGIPEFKGSLI